MSTCSTDEVCFHGHSPVPACTIPKYQPILTVGLNNDKMNGIVGVLGEYNVRSKRFAVLFPDNKTRLIKPMNLTDPPV